MNDLDMELQTIRQKLQTLKASPPEMVTAPWSPSRLAAPSPNLAQITTAIETLRQRSGQTLSPPVSNTSLQQFDAALSTVAQLAQQQQQALERLQSLGKSLVEQSTPGTSPDIDDIARFLAEYPTIQIPMVQRDTDGYLDMVYHAVYLNGSGQSSTNSLKSRTQLFGHPFNNTQRQSSSTELDESPYENPQLPGLLDELTHFWQVNSQAFQKWTHHQINSTQRSRSSNFTLLDGTIWCIGAIITRVILKSIFQFYPASWTPIAFMLIAGIIFTLYRSIFSPRPNPVVGYRTLMIIIGLLIGGRFT